MAKRTHIGHLWLAPARIRRRARRAVKPPPTQEELIRHYAKGRSFADIGCMWGAHGKFAFAAEEEGATAVTAVDLMAPTAEYEAEHARRESQVRFVHGDLRDPATVERVGRHDVVWCIGILCVDEVPILTLQRLREMTGEYLIVDASTLPEVPGVPQATVFYPGLTDEQRRVYHPVDRGMRKSITQPFDPSRPNGSWWWGLTPSAFRGMLFAVGLEPVEWIDEGFHVTAVARPLER